MNAPQRQRLSSRHWFGKSCAGLVLGFGLGLALTGLFAWLGPGGIAGGSARPQFNMWMVAPIWCAVLALVFLFRDSLRAWLWLGLANAVAFALLWLLHATMA
ncbi:MAG: hypothetical protein QM599_10380 [Pseudoxanthomonas sp.]